MKYILLLPFFLVAAISFAQPALVVGVTIEERSKPLPSDIEDMLYNRVQRGLAKHGVGANGSALLTVLTTVDEGELSVTATAPVRYVRSYFVELQLANKESGEVFATYSEEVKVAKRSEAEAIRAAIASLKLRGTDFQEFVGKAKTEIQSYYTTNCDALIAKANQRFTTGDHLSGFSLLTAIPSETSSCREQATTILAEAYAEYEVLACDRQIAHAEAFASNEDFSAAVLQLLTIPNPGLCQDRFTALTMRIQSQRQKLRADALDRLDRLREIRVDREERRRRFLENLAFIYARPDRPRIDGTGQVIIVNR